MQTVPIMERIDAASSLDEERTLFSLSVAPDQVPEDRLPMTHRRVLAYWNARRGSNRAARRSDIDPCDLAYALPHLILWDCIEHTDYRVRLAGTEICRNMLGELRGTLLGEMPCPLLSEARREFDAVRDQGLVSVAERTLHWLGRPLAYYRHLILPLTNSVGEIHMLMSTMTFERVDDRR
ncbi:MAG: hypothetical protein JWO51_1966 [Rhodospirillales bacterium]|nr:hypothetical protein [Rhodospirillales bacterium]